MSDPSARRGLGYGLVAYLLWGFLPLFWKLLQPVPALEIICHRIVWSMAFTGILLGLRGGLGRTLQQCRQPGLLLATAWTALLLGGNWLLFIYAVNSGHVLQASLGYFIGPLVSAALGVFLLRERLSAAQTAAFALAGGGVVLLAFAGGKPPWLALALAITFAWYGLGRKVGQLGSLEGLFVESALLVPPAVAWILWLEVRGLGAFLHGPPEITWLLVAGGVVTSTPLLFFAAAARRMPLNALGLLQYLAPSMQFLMGVFLFHEPFGRVQAGAFALIWAGLAVYSVAGLAGRPGRPLPGSG